MEQTWTNPARRRFLKVEAGPDLLDRVRSQARRERRTIRACVLRALEHYLDGGRSDDVSISPKLIRRLRIVAVQEGVEGTASDLVEEAVRLYLDLVEKSLDEQDEDESH